MTIGADEAANDEGVRLNTGANDEDIVAAAQEVLRSESASISLVASQLDDQIAAAIRLMHDRTAEPKAGTIGGGSIVVSGIGKSGIVGQRISASMSSTGTPSHFLHPVEALHGDLGRVRRNDVALLLSYSGETAEVINLLDFLKRQNVPVVAITATKTSTLGRLADITLTLGRLEEVCPLGLAPTTSVNCISAVGDALFLGIMSLRQFSKEDFATFHPGGSLGRKLLKVHQVMEFKLGDNFVPLLDTLTLNEVFRAEAASGRRAGAVVLVDPQGYLTGVFTDGDLRRHLRSTENLLDTPMNALMTRKPKHIHKDALASEALALLNQYRIDELPVVDSDMRAVGLIDVQDLVRLRVVD